MHIRDFDLSRLPRAGKERLWLDLSARDGGGSWRLPLMTVSGASEGPTLLVLAGIHGDEYEGIIAIPQVYAQVETSDLRGRLVMAPVCNLPAYEAAERGSPIDGLNLARVFPGARDGSITRQIAYWLAEKFIRQADFLIDLHTGGIAYELPLLIGYVHDDGEVGRASLAAATAFGAPVMWGHPLPPNPGRTISTAVNLDVPCLYTEAPGGSGADRDVVDCFREGVLNVMKHLGMLPGGLVQRPLAHHLVGDGNLDTVISAPCAGLFQREVALLDEVKSGAVAGDGSRRTGRNLVGDPRRSRWRDHHAARLAARAGRRWPRAYYAPSCLVNGIDVLRDHVFSLSG